MTAGEFSTDIWHLDF